MSCIGHVSVNTNITYDICILLYLLFCSLQIISAAEDDPNCSIYGMPVLRVWKSKLVFVSKRTVGNTGYAGMENPILYKDNVEVILGDAHDTCEELRSAFT